MNAKASKPHVLIIGGGLAGLTLAQALRKQNVSFEVFERSPNNRFQGWAIGIHSIIDELISSFPSDMPPLSKVDVFLPFALPAQMIFYQNNKLEPRYGVQDNGSKAIIRSNRQRLRAWLAAGIPMKFNKTATVIEDCGSGGIKVHFQDGTSAIGDIVVGADGVSSAIRKHLVKPDPVQVLPIASVVGEVVLSGRDFEQQLELGYSGYVASDSGTKDDGRGQMFVGLDSVSDDGKSGSYYWSMTYFDPAASTLPHWSASTSKARRYELALEKTTHLLPQFREIIKKTGPEGMSDNPLCFRELEIESLPVGNVTLVGDAAHCMTPFRGEGGVQAMRDALKLSRAIGNIAQSDANDDQIKKVMAEYQDEMLQRGGNAVRLSREEWTKVADGSRAGWGTRGVAIPPVRISLSDIPRAK